MRTINVEENKFTCPLLDKEISLDGDITFAVCSKCKFNVFKQVIDNKVYCEYSS